MQITVPKNELQFLEGGAEAIIPPGDFKKVGIEYARNPSDDPITVKSISIANTIKIGKKFIEVVTMDSKHCDISNPNTEVWFYVKLSYPWPIKDNSQDCDEILTDGDKFYLVRRGLAKSPFILNKYSQNKIVLAIQEYVETL